MTDLQRMIVNRRVSFPGESLMKTSEAVGCSRAYVVTVCWRFSLPKNPTGGPVGRSSPGKKCKARALFKNNPYASEKTVMSRLNVSLDAARVLIQRYRPKD